MNSSKPNTAVPVRVWDLPTRIFHWLLAACVIGSAVSAQLGGNAMVWHFRLGYTICTLLVFRLLWGLVGGHWSRFASFVPTPGRFRRYLRGQPLPGEYFDAGHNPLGSLSVLALIGFLAVQVATGLVADDEIANVGPLNRFVSGATAAAATWWHAGWGKGILIALVLLHVGAILYYRFGRSTNLVWPMLSGDKALAPGTPASADGAASRALALVLLAACAAATGWLVGLGG